MALTYKVQFLDDTDPFASTNFPEPSRPPTYTFHLNIPLGQQIASLHRLLKAPHSVRATASRLSCDGFRGLFAGFVKLIKMSHVVFLDLVGGRCSTTLAQWNISRPGVVLGGASWWLGRVSGKVFYTKLSWTGSLASPSPSLSMNELCRANLQSVQASTLFFSVLQPQEYSHSPDAIISSSPQLHRWVCELCFTSCDL